MLAKQHVPPSTVTYIMAMAFFYRAHFIILQFNALNAEDQNICVGL